MTPPFPAASLSKWCLINNRNLAQIRAKGTGRFIEENAVTLWLPEGGTWVLRMGQLLPNFGPKFGHKIEFE